MTPSSLANLPDGGAKVHSRLAILRKELASLEGTGELITAGYCCLNCNKHISSSAATPVGLHFNVRAQSANV